METEQPAQLKEPMMIDQVEPSMPGETVPFRTNFLRLFFLFLPLAILAPCLQADITIVLPDLYASYRSTSVDRDIEVVLLMVFFDIPLETVFDVGIWPWFIVVGVLNAVIIIIFGSRLSRFWLVAASWGTACLIADMSTGQLGIRSIMTSTLLILFDALGGVLVGWLFWRPLARIPLLKKTVAKVRRGPAWALPPRTALESDELVIDAAAIATGWVALSVLFTYRWVVFVVPVLIGILLVRDPSLGKSVVGAFVELVVLLSVAPYLIHFVFASALQSVGIPEALALPMSMLLIVLCVIYVLLTPILLVSALLNYKTKTCYVFLAFTLAFLTAGNLLFFVIRPNWFHIEALYSYDTALGFTAIALFFGGSKYRLKVRVPVREDWDSFSSKWRGRLVKALPSDARPLLDHSLVKAYESSVRLWLGAVTHPLVTLERYLRLTKKEQLRHLKELTSSSFLVSVPVALVSGLLVRGGSGGFYGNSIGKAILIVSVLVGGVVCHWIFRIFRLPSDFAKTLILFSVPQAICMPIIAMISVPAITFDHKILLEMNDQNFSMLDIFRHVVARMYSAPPAQGRFFEVLNFLSFIVNELLAIFFLESFWQHYRIARSKVYSIGMIALSFNSIIMGLVVTPAGILLGYWFT